MLSVIDMETLFEILSQTENSLEFCFQNFSKHFASDLFKPCYTLMGLLSNNVLKIIFNIFLFKCKF